MTGRLDGTAKYYYSSGAVETRIYENGVLQVRHNYSYSAVYSGEYAREQQ